MRRAWGGNFHPLLSPPTLQIGVDHVALDRPGADNRHLDHQIVEFTRPQPGQHIHLRAAFDLEHPERIALAQHCVSFRILSGHSGQIEPSFMMLFKQIEAFPDTGQHPQRQHIHFQDAERVDIVFVPFDEGPLGHRAIADRHGFGQRALRQDKAAHMLG